MINEARTTHGPEPAPTPAPQPSGTVLDRLPRKVRARLDPLGSLIGFEPGDEVLRAGVPTPFLGVVQRGRVALRLRVPERGRVTIVTVEPGELLGWSAVVPPYRVTADAVATEPARVLAFDARSLRERLAGDHELAATLLPLVLESVSERLSASWDQLLDVFGPQPWEPW